MINQIATLPVLFYRLRETRAIEANLIQTAHLELSKAIKDLGVLATPKVVRGLPVSCLLRELPKDTNHLIGYGLKKAGIFPSKILSLSVLKNGSILMDALMRSLKKCFQSSHPKLISIS